MSTGPILNRRSSRDYPAASVAHFLTAAYMAHTDWKQ
jgi:hypothetical protein